MQQHISHITWQRPLACDPPIQNSMPPKITHKNTTKTSKHLRHLSYKRQSKSIKSFPPPPKKKKKKPQNISRIKTFLFQYPLCVHFFPMVSFPQPPTKNVPRPPQKNTGFRPPRHMDLTQSTIACVVLEQASTKGETGLGEKDS